MSLVRYTFIYQWFLFTLRKSFYMLINKKENLTGLGMFLIFNLILSMGQNLGLVILDVLLRIKCGQNDKGCISFST